MQSLEEESEDLRRLDQGWFSASLPYLKEIITAPQVAAELDLSERMARNHLATWVKNGWLIVTNPSRPARSCSLSAKYRQYIGSLSAIDRAGEEKEQ